MFCCCAPRLSPLQWDREYSLSESSIREHGIDLETKISSLPMYRGSKFEIARENVLLLDEDIPPCEWPDDPTCCFSRRLYKIFCTCFDWRPTEHRTSEIVPRQFYTVKRVRQEMAHTRPSTPR